MEKFLKIITGDMEGAVFLGYFAIACFVALLMFAVKGNKSKLNNPETPNKFSWGFLIQDNLLPLLTTVGGIALAIRFSNELVGQQITGWVSVVIGLTIKVIITKLKTISDQARD